jgi:hypothetical protein
LDNITNEGELIMYLDGRPQATRRMEATDQGIILRHGDDPRDCDYFGAREALIFKEDDTYHLFYDGIRPDGTRACLATSRDLVNWRKHGPILEKGLPGTRDAGAVCSPWVIHDGREWHMFYIGSPTGKELPDFPYLTLKAKSARLAGPWVKQYDVIPFNTCADTYYSVTASAGCIVRHSGEYLQFFSSTTQMASHPYVLRTLGIARTSDLDGAWQLDLSPVVPVQEQVENTSLYFEPANSLWFLFTNHIGIEEDEEHGVVEYTDAIWVYWSYDLNAWNPEDKAIVIDGKNCTWAKRCIGMPSVIVVGGRLAVFYDAPAGDDFSHFHRDIGLAWLTLPLKPGT